MNYKTLKIFLLVLCLALIPLSPFAYTPETLSQLPPPIAHLLQRYRIPSDSLSLYILDLETQQPLLTLNPDTPRSPASVIKLLTTYAGLELLGPTYTWETRFYLDGTLNNGVLKGNLVFQGGGDPFLTRETFWHMLHNLRARGLREINGNLIIDDSLFEDEPGSPGDFDKRPYQVYNTLPDAALINFNAQEFVIIPDHQQVTIYADPPAANLQIRNKLRLTSGKCNDVDADLNMQVLPQGAEIIAEFTGNYPASCGEQVLLRSIIQNDQYVYGVFKAMWQEMGGTITGSYAHGVTSSSSQPFYMEPSKPLHEIIANINKYSNNVMARQLLLTIGQMVIGAPGSNASGVQAIEQWLKDIGINAPELVLENGAGLSRTTQISASTLVKLLEHAWNGPLQPEFLASFPIAGKDGTMRKRLNGKILPGSIRIKTGMLNGVRSMAGYVYSRNHKHYAVVSLQNYPGIQNTTGTTIQDELLKWLYEQ